MSFSFSPKELGFVGLGENKRRIPTDRRKETVRRVVLIPISTLKDWDLVDERDGQPRIADGKTILAIYYEQSPL